VNFKKNNFFLIFRDCTKAVSRKSQQKLEPTTYL